MPSAGRVPLEPESRPAAASAQFGIADAAILPPAGGKGSASGGSEDGHEDHGGGGGCLRRI